MSTFEYTAELQLNDGSIVTVDLEERGWAEPNRLANTRVFTLVPKDPQSRWPFVRVHIPEGAKPIFKSRMNKLVTAGKEFRAYAVGWFKGSDSHWTWVLPNGSIEQGTDEPSFIKILTEQVNEAWRQSLPKG